MKNFNKAHFPVGKWGKIVFFMKLKIVALLCSMGALTAAPGYTQDKKFDASYLKASLVSVLNDLESQTGYYFVYFDGVVPENITVTVSLSNVSLEQLLDEVLTKNGFTYKIAEMVIGIGKAETRVAQQTPVSISGTVIDTSNRPVAGASVTIPGTSRGTITDNSGRFVIGVPAESDILRVSFLGMVTQEVKISGRTSLTIVLVEARYNIGEVVVTGIFTKAKESYTGAVTVISREELKVAGNRNVLSSISNIDPSFNVMQNLEYGSDPNRLPDITMRGRTGMDVSVRDLQDESTAQSRANLPLFILDGFEISLQRVIDMDQEMIETITLLKDASATAMYGARGANGIVVITSRRPETGKIHISYRANLNIEAPDLTSYNLMNSREKLAYEKAAGLYASTIDATFQGLQELYNLRLIEVERGVDTYWLKYPVRTGVGQRHSLVLDGGSDNFRYSAGLSYNNVAGVMKESKRNTFSGNLFFQYELNNVRFQNDLTISRNKSGNSPYGSFSEYASANPIATPYDEEGQLKKMIVEPYTGNTPASVGNPLYNATLPYRDDTSYTNIQNNFAVDWNITPDLMLRGRFGFTRQESRSDKYLSREHTSFETDYYSGENYKLRGSYTYGTGYDFSYEADVTLNYNKVFAEKHQLYVGFNFNMAESEVETYTIIGMGYAAVNMINLAVGGAYPPDSYPSGTQSLSRRLGSTSNVNYTYDGRYFVDFSGKIEGSSKFGANNRTAPFWSAGMGWNVHNETFMKNLKVVNSLRVRFSFGTTGSQEFNPYQALTTYRYYTQGYKYWNGFYMIALGNEDLSWQKTRQANLGLEAMLFERRVSFSVDLYNKDTDALLADVNLPTSAGFGSYKANIGEVRNRGIEANFNVYIVRNADGFTWSVGGSLAHNKNKILKISNALEFLNEELMEASGSNPSYLYKEGRSMNTIYVVRSLGIDPATGREIYLNKYGERTTDWDASDKVACGVEEPKAWGNLRTMLRWKNLSLNATFSYTLGGDIYNQTLIDKVENISTTRTGVNNPWNNLDRRAYYERWQNAGDSSYFKDIRNFEATQASSRFIMKENALRLNSLNLSYDFNREWLKKNSGTLEYLNVAFYAEDIFYLSTIKRERGTTYPFSRQFSLTVSTRF